MKAEDEAHLRATSKVAPPHISRLAQGARILEVAGAALSMSCVRMRVASRLWCASRLQVCAWQLNPRGHTAYSQGM